jgi:spermidine synthase
MAKQGGWNVEMVNDGDYALCKILKEFWKGQTAFQQAQVCEFESYGKALVLDGLMQSTENDEFIYHESLVHPALISHPFPHYLCWWRGGRCHN